MCRKTVIHIVKFEEWREVFGLGGRQEHDELVREYVVEAYEDEAEAEAEVNRLNAMHRGNGEHYVDSVYLNLKKIPATACPV